MASLSGADTLRILGPIIDWNLHFQSAVPGKLELAYVQSMPRHEGKYLCRFLRLDAEPPAAEDRRAFFGKYIEEVGFIGRNLLLRNGDDQDLKIKLRSYEGAFANFLVETHPGVDLEEEFLRNGREQWALNWELVRDPDFERIRSELVRVAADVVEGRTEMLPALKNVMPLIYQLPEYGSDLFHGFVGIDSQLDDVPGMALHNQPHADYQAKIAAETADFVTFFRDAFNENCRAIIAHYSGG